MTCRVWTDGSAADSNSPMGGDPLPFSGNSSGGSGGGGGNGGRELGCMGAHTEFVMGVDWCLFGSEGWCASCGWDEKLLVWDVRTCMM